MTKADVYNLKNDKIYRFDLYTGKTYYGFIEIINYAENKFYLVPKNKLKEYQNSRLTQEEKLDVGIYIPINIELIDDWEVQHK
jgi:hypothetical protein